jgi:DNA-binding Xre family transcriptional regulator
VKGLWELLIGVLLFVASSPARTTRTGGRRRSRSGCVSRTTPTMTYRMAEKGMYATTDLVPPLAERGVELSREQVFRLVTQPLQRLSMDVLAALFDSLDCHPNDLIEVEVVNQKVRKTADGTTGTPPQVRRTTVRRPDLS